MAAPIPLFKVRVPDGVGPALAATLASGQIAQGAPVEDFERRLAQYVGNDKVCAVGDVSAALTLALVLAGVKPADEVILSPMVCLATSMPVANLHARPVWCDIDPRTGMIDPGRIGSLVTARTRAVIAYNWSGDVAHLDELAVAAGSRGLKLIVDASEAFGAEYRGERLGHGLADFTVYSFSAVRHFTAGEGGALFFADGGHLERCRRLRHYGIDPRTFRMRGGDLNPESDIPAPGYNFRMNTLAATIGLAQFRDLDAVIHRFRENGRYFDRALRGVAALTPLSRRDDSISGYWTYALRAERRDDLVRKLHAEGIGCQRLHVRNDRYSCFADSARANALPGVDIFDRENLSVPCGWWVGDEDRERIVHCIRAGW